MSEETNRLHRFTWRAIRDLQKASMDLDFATHHGASDEPMKKARDRVKAAEQELATYLGEEPK